MLREVIFSGFQLELYTAEERVFAYWYATQVIESHLSCIDNIMTATPQGKSSRTIFFDFP
jgi:hypothetical protein